MAKYTVVTWKAWNKHGLSPRWSKYHFAEIQDHQATFGEFKTVCSRFVPNGDEVHILALGYGNKRIVDCTSCKKKLEKLINEHRGRSAK